MAVARDPCNPTCPHPDKDGSDPVQSAQTPNAVLPLQLRENLIRRFLCELLNVVLDDIRLFV